MTSVNPMTSTATSADRDQRALAASASRGAGSDPTPHLVRLERGPLDPGQYVVHRTFDSYTRAVFDPAQCGKQWAQDRITDTLRTRNGIADVEFSDEPTPDKTESLNAFANRLATQEPTPILREAAHRVADNAEPELPKLAEKIRAALDLTPAARHQVATLLDLRAEYADRPHSLAFVDQWIDMVVATNDPDTVLDQVCDILRAEQAARS